MLVRTNIHVFPKDETRFTVDRRNKFICFELSSDSTIFFHENPVDCINRTIMLLKEAKKDYIKEVDNEV